MKRYGLSLILWLGLASPVTAWNHTGHMIVAALAYRQISPQARQAAAAILARHPDLDEFLRTGNSSGYTQDEWIFLRGAAWPDWVRRGPEEDFSHPTWHYINLPFVPGGSHVHPEPAKQPNVVTQIPFSIEQLRQGSPRDRAISLCWIIHLLGDIHQPLHCTTLLSDEFPRSDDGGNLALLRIESHRPTKLHPLWDDLLGTKTNRAAIDRVVEQIDRLEQQDRDQLQRDLDANATIESWAQESFAVAVKYAYLDGGLPLANESRHPAEDEVPSVPESYARQAGTIARLQVAKAGARLAALLDELLR